MIIKKGHGYFRKSKAYGLSSCIVLGTTLLLGTGVVSAQETTAKTEVRTEQVAKQAELSKSLNDSIAIAKKENVKVTVKGDKVVSLKDSDEAIKKELEKINKAIQQ